MKINITHKNILIYISMLMFICDKVLFLFHNVLDKLDSIKVKKQKILILVIHIYNTFNKYIV